MDLKSIVAKLAAKNASSQFGLGKAFSDISEPLQIADAPITDAVNVAAQKFGQLTDLTGGADKDHQARAATAFNTFANAVVPTPSSLTMGAVGKVLPMMKAVKPKAIAQSMAKEKSAAELYRDATASKYGKVAVKPEPIKQFGTVTVKQPTDALGNVWVNSDSLAGKVKVLP